MPTGRMKKKRKNSHRNGRCLQNAPRRNPRWGERGNVFFTLFGAVALVGVLGAGIMATMRGPLTSMVEVQKRTRAESEMIIAAKLSVLEASQNAFDGDCDEDGFVEPLEYNDASPAPTGGGQIPSDVSVNKNDPWGTPYGYCVWNPGPDIAADTDCDDDSSSSYERLDGTNDSDDTYAVIALVSAGPDRSFDTTCTGGASPTATKASGADDLLYTYTYAEAVTESGGLWTIKSGDPDTAEIDKDLEITGDAQFSGELTGYSGGASAALQIGAKSLLLPTDSDIADSECDGTGDAANANVLRVNETTSPPSLELCNGGNAWVSVAEAAAKWTDGTDEAGEVYHTGNVGIGTGMTDPEYTLDVTGTTNITGAVTLGSTLNVTGTTNLAALNATGAVDFDSTFNADGIATLGSTLGVTGATTLSNTLTVSGLTTINNNVDIVGTGSGDALDVSGAADVSGSFNATSSATFGDTVDVTGATTLSDTLTVEGLTTINDNVDIVGTGTGNAVDVTGNTYISGNLEVDGTTTLDGDVAATDGQIEIIDNVSVTGTVNATGNITTSGGTFMIGTDNLTPPSPICDTVVEKVHWDGNSWECVATGASGTGAGGVLTLDDVLDNDNDAGGNSADNFNQIGADYFCKADLTGCKEIDSIIATSVFEIDSNVVRPGSDVDESLADFVFGSDQLADASDANKDSRFFFDKSAGAFRAGAVTGTQWDTVGNYSAGFGYETSATGGYSMAWGHTTSAGGDYSTAFGDEVSVTGSHSVGIGLQGGAQTTDPVVSGDRSMVLFFDGGVADANSTYNFSSDDMFGLVGGEFFISETQSNGASAGCIRYNASSDKLELAHDCLTYSEISTGSSSIWSEDGSNDYIEYDDSLGGVRIGKVTGQPAPALDWTLDVGNSVVYTSNGVAIGGSSLSAGVQTLELDVTGDVGATNYCDADGNNCFVASDVSAAATAPGNATEVIFNSGGGSFGADSGFTFNSATDDVTVGGDLTITGDDLVMNTNTAGYLLMADGTNYNPTSAAGDVGVESGSFVINADAVEEYMLKAVDAAADEECLTYETTTGDFEWEDCNDGAVNVAGSDTQIQFNDSGTLAADSGFTFNSATDDVTVGGDLTITGDDLVMNTNTAGYLLMADGTNYNPTSAAGDVGVESGSFVINADAVEEYMLKAVNAATDEYCLTYETTTGDFEWEDCNDGVDTTTAPGSSTEIIFNDGGVYGTDSNFTFNSVTDNLTIGGDLTITGDDLVMNTNTAGYLLIGGGSDYSPTAISGDATLAADGTLTVTSSAITPGSDTQIVFNDSGTLAADSGFTFNSATDDVTVGGDLTITGDDLVMNTNTAGYLLMADGTNYNPTSAAGDVGVESGSFVINADAVEEYMLKAVDAAADEECLTYETTTGDFEWEDCNDGAVNVAGSDTQIQFNDSGTLAADSGFTFNSATDDVTVGGDLTITGDDLVMNTNTAGYLLMADGTNYNPTSAAGDVGVESGSFVINADAVEEYMLKAVNAATDEYCLTYETTTGDFEWEDCNDGAVNVAGSDTQIQFNDSGTLAADSGFTFNSATDDVTVGGDLTITGDDIVMNTNTAGYLLIGGGSDYSPTAISGDATLAADGTLTVTSSAITPGSDTQIVFNDSGTLAADSGFTFNSATDDVTVGGDLTITGDDLVMNTNTAGYLLMADGTNYNPTSAAGDVGVESGSFVINADAVEEYMLKAVNAATDEYCLTYETTTGDFEWEDCNDGAESQVWEIDTNVMRPASGIADYSADDFVFGSYQLADTSTGNEDARMYFDKSQSAFRAGTVTGTQWDSPGQYSTAFGLDTTASNIGATAWGRGTQATGQYATAWGYDGQSSTTANGVSRNRMGPWQRCKQ